VIGAAAGANLLWAARVQTRAIQRQEPKTNGK
jgi:hypothetical protein